MGNYGSANLREVPELKKRVAIVRYSMYIRLFKMTNNSWFMADLKTNEN